MSLQQSPANTVEPPSAQGESETRLHGRWLVLAWLGWSILTLLSLVDFVTSIQEYLGDVRTLCRAGSCVPGQPTPQTAQVLHQFGISVGAYAALNVGLISITGVVFCAVAAVIVWRKPNDWMALLTTSTFITQGLFEYNYLQGPLNNPASPWYAANVALSYISPVQFLFFCAFFPNGRSVPRWMGWLLAVICLVDLLPTLFPSLPFSGLVETLFVLSGFPLVVGSMIYRYRRVSTPVERQQTKWVVFGITLVLFTFMLWFVPQVISYSRLSLPGSLYDLIGHPLLTLSGLFAPICIGIAVLRYRLWDIDVIINKALVYGTLTTLLAAVYAGLIVGLENLAGLFSSQGAQPPVIVVSTLIIAALFQPLRHRIQQIIDRRFYRRKYNAARTLAAFSATLRHEVDLATLSEHLVEVVRETMQPASLSLWLRPPSHPHLSWRANPSLPPQNEARDDFAGE